MKAIFLTVIIALSFGCAGTLFKVANDDVGSFEVNGNGLDVSIEASTNTTGLVCLVFDAGWMDWAKFATDFLCPKGAE